MAEQNPFADPSPRVGFPAFSSHPVNVRPVRAPRKGKGKVDKSMVGKPVFVDSSNGITPSGFVAPPPPPPPPPAVVWGAGEYPRPMSRVEALRAPGARKKHRQPTPLARSFVFWFAVGLFLLAFGSSAAAIGVAAYMATSGITIPSWVVLWVVISVVLGVVFVLWVLAVALKKGMKKEMEAGLLVRGDGQRAGDIELEEGVGGGLGRRVLEREGV